MTRKKAVSHYKTMLGYSLLAVGIILFDRITKYFVMMYGYVYITSFCALNLDYNMGITFGMFPARTIGQVWTIIGFASCITVLVAVAGWMRYRQGYSSIPELLIVSGSLSNLIDRIIYGGVVDFIELSYDRYVWPPFNVADIAIVVGTFLLVLSVYASSHEK